MNEVFDLSITQLNSRLRSGKLSSVELVKHYLDRIEKLDPKLNSFITVTDKLALDQAKAADELFSQGKASLLTGIPFSLKDAFVVDWETTTAGSAVLKNYKPVYSATVYSKLISAGAVLVGKNNQDAWGHGVSTENSDFGPVKNPYDLTRTAGGSSGGCGAAIATNLASFAIGEDTGGSIRNPASFSGVTGLKVTYGRVSRYGAIAYASSLDTVGPIARSAEDTAIVLNQIAGYDPMDASSSATPVPDYSQHLAKSIKGLRIGLIKEYFAQGLDPQVNQIVNRAATELESLGAVLSEVSIPTTKYGVAIYYILVLSETSSNLARYDGIRYGGMRNLFSQEAKRRIMTGTFSLSSGYYDAYYKKALQARTLLINEFNRAFQQVDVLLGPVMPYTAPLLKEYSQAPIDPLADYLADLYTCPINPVGVPSLSVPAGFNDHHLPVGVQLIGPMFSEDLLIRLAYQYQQCTNYHLDKPNIG